MLKVIATTCKNKGNAEAYACVTSNLWDVKCTCKCLNHQALLRTKLGRGACTRCNSGMFIYLVSCLLSATQSKCKKTLDRLHLLAITCSTEKFLVVLYVKKNYIILHGLLVYYVINMPQQTVTSPKKCQISKISYDYWICKNNEWLFMVKPANTYCSHNLRERKSSSRLVDTAVYYM